MPSERYRHFLKLSAEFHATHKTFSGRGVKKHATALVDFSKRIGATSALDYGCGKGAHYGDLIAVLGGQTIEQALGFEVAKYDPAWPPFSTVPAGAFDLVWCTDVLEHIPEEDMGWVMGVLWGYATKGLFITVGNFPSKKSFSDGTNTHVTVKPIEWWDEVIGRDRPAGVDLLRLVA